MLVLVEPLIFDEIVDYPHLGCAALMAACRAKGISTVLVKGQTWFLQDLFITDVEESWHLIHELTDEQWQAVGLTPQFARFDLDQFRTKLKGLYTIYEGQRDPRQYLSFPQAVGEIEKWLGLLAVARSHFAEKLSAVQLGFVERYVNAILKENPRYVGFSLQRKFGPLSRAIRRRLRQKADVPIIVGGAMTPYIDRQELDALFSQEEFDYLVVGPGDEALPALVEALDHNREPVGIPNVFYRRNGTVQTNEVRAVDLLGALPAPDFSQFDLGRYPVPTTILPLETGRGCSWRKCAFCSTESWTLGTYRTFPVERVLETLRHHRSAYGVSCFALHDAEVPPSRMRSLCQALLASDLAGKVSLYFYARFEEGYDDAELLKLMSRAGVSAIHWGLESGCQRVLDLMNKGTKVESASRILRKSALAGISNQCFIFFGFPGESTAEAQSTVDFLQEHGESIDSFTDGRFCVAPLSPIAERPGDWGVTLHNDGSYTPPPGSLTEAEAIAFTKKFELRCAAGGLQVGSQKIKDISGGNHNRMRCFLLSSYLLLSRTEAMDRLQRKQYAGIYPLVGGNLQSTAKGPLLLGQPDALLPEPSGAKPTIVESHFWQPVNFKETPQINQIRPSRGRALDPLEAWLFTLSDGRLSVADIIMKTCAREEGAVNTAMEERVAAFYGEIFTHDWALTFARPWHQ